jgi:hypothetical protein
MIPGPKVDRYVFLTVLHLFLFCYSWVFIAAVWVFGSAIVFFLKSADQYTIWLSEEGSNDSN